MKNILFKKQELNIEYLPCENSECLSPDKHSMTHIYIYNGKEYHIETLKEMFDMFADVIMENQNKT